MTMKCCMLRGRGHKEVWVVFCAALGSSAWGLGLQRNPMEAVAAWSSTEHSLRLLCSCLFSWTSVVDIVQTRVACPGLKSRGCFMVKFLLWNSVGTSCMSCGLSILNPVPKANAGITCLLSGNGWKSVFCMVHTLFLAQTFSPDMICLDTSDRRELRNPRWCSSRATPKVMAPADWSILTQWSTNVCG